MSLILTGIVHGMRPVGGVVQNGERKGEKWAFLSMEIADTGAARVYSCQMRSNDKQYKDMVTVTQVKDERGQPVDKHVLKPEYDYTGHKVRVKIMGITAGEREIEDKDTGDKRTVIQVRAQITNLRDLGIPEDDE